MAPSRTGAVSLLLAAACATTRPGTTPGPARAAVTAVEFPRLGSRGGEVVLAFRVETAEAAIAIRVADFELRVDGPVLAAGRVALDQAVPPRTAKEIRFSVPLAHPGLAPATAEALARGETVAVIVRGALSGTAGTDAIAVPFEGLRAVRPERVDSLDALP